MTDLQLEFPKNHAESENSLKGKEKNIVYFLWQNVGAPLLAFLLASKTVLGLDVVAHAFDSSTQEERSDWSIDWVPDEPSYTERPCLKNKQENLAVFAFEIYSLKLKSITFSLFN